MNSAMITDNQNRMWDLIDLCIGICSLISHPAMKLICSITSTHSNEGFVDLFFYPSLSHRSYSYETFDKIPQ